MYSQKEDHRQDYMAELYREEQKQSAMRIFALRFASFRS